MREEWADDTRANGAPTGFLAEIDRPALVALLALAADAAGADTMTLCVSGHGLRWRRPPPCAADSGTLEFIPCNRAEGAGASAPAPSGAPCPCGHAIPLRSGQSGIEAFLCPGVAPRAGRHRWRLCALALQASALISLHGELKQQSVLSGESDHRVKNALQSVASYLHLHEMRADDTDTRDVLAAAGRHVHAIALIHDALSRTGPTPTIRIDRYMERLAGLLNTLMPDDVTLNVGFPSVTVAPDVATGIAMIANEFVTNSAKHAFPPGRRGSVTIKGDADGITLRRVTMMDDGIGADRTGAGSGLGGKIIDAAARKLGCQIDHTPDINGGCRLVLTFFGSNEPETTARDCRPCDTESLYGLALPPQP